MSELRMDENGDMYEAVPRPAKAERLSPGGTRANHLAWCKQRALEYVDRGDVSQAWASMCSDLNKDDQTRGHVGVELGMMLLMSGMLETPRQMREFINGFN